MRLHLLFLLILCTASVSAFTITPAKTLFDTPGTHEFTVIVRGNEEGTVHIRAEGDLAQVITFEKEAQQMSGEAIFKGTITIPENMTPGDHGQELIVSLQNAETGSLVPKIELASLLIVRKPYNGPHLVGNTYSRAASANTTRLTFTLENRGTAPVTPSAIIIDANEQTTVVPRLIASGGATQFSTLLNGQGEYPLKITVQGDAPLTLQENIRIGYPTIEVFTAELIPETGNITPIEVNAKVNWNIPIEAELTIAGKAQIVTIDGIIQDTFYTESPEQNISLNLRIGEETRTVQLSHTMFAAQHVSKRNMWIVLIIAIMLLLWGIWYLYRRKRVETFI